MEKRHGLTYLPLLALLLLTAFAAAGCTDSDDVGDNYKTFTGETIKDYLDGHAEYSEFETALDVAGALPLMSSYGKYTFFLPDNEAVDRYVAEKGYASFEAFLDSVDAVKKMVYYHIIDGEANSAGTYLTTNFGTSNIETKNMTGRYLYTTMSADGVTWLVNKEARITSPNNVMVNGVVHIVDRVVEGNEELVYDYIAHSSDFTLYAEALRATGLSDSLSLIEDESYVRPTGLSPAAPERRLYGYTALLEPDDVLRSCGIGDLDAMRRKAEELYPDGAGRADDDAAGSLYRFVAYHLVPYKITSSKLCPTRDMTVTQTFIVPEWQTENFRDGKFSLDNYLFPMAENTVINVQKFVWRDQSEQTPVFNDPRNPYDPQYVNMNNEAPDVVTLDMARSDIDCLNGQIHSLTGLLHYRDDVFHKRLRMDFASFLPELYSNDLLDGNHNLPRGYCRAVSYDDKDGISLNHYVRYGTHSYWWGDVLMVRGRCNFEIELGPIPSGSYEVRIGYHVRTNDYGVVQYYIDGEPCGIPLDQSITATKGDIGWTQTWFYLHGGVEQNPITAGTWVSGKETEDDYYGYDNDKAMHNLGYMKAPDSYCSTELANGDTSPIHAGTARNDGYALRRVLTMVTWPTTTKHTLRVSNLMDKGFDLDFIEFMPKDLIEDEDTH